MIGVIDIGAHWFEEHRQWHNQGARNFLLFEPITENYNHIINNFSSENIKVFKIALANYTGEAKMVTDPGHHYFSASLLTPTLHKEDYPAVDFSSFEIAQVDRLDNIEYDRSLYDFMYMTAQGSDLEILRGAEKSLGFINEIVCQSFTRRLYEGSFITPEIVEYLTDKQFILKTRISTGISRERLKFVRK